MLVVIVSGGKTLLIIVGMFANVGSIEDPGLTAWRCRGALQVCSHILHGGVNRPHRLMSDILQSTPRPVSMRCSTDLIIGDSIGRQAGRFG